MPKMSRSTAAERIEVEGLEGHYGEAGDMTIGFEAYHADADLAPLFRGLPDDRCQSRHWGYVLSGKVIFHGADGDETFEAGDAYVVGPGHTPEIFAGTEVVEFTPTDEHLASMEAVARNTGSA